MSVGQEPLENYRYNAGVAYISLVSNLGREEYINVCYKTNTVSVKFEDGSISHQVPIDVMVMCFIEFPLTIEERGTPVIWVAEPITGKPIIVGRVPRNDEMLGMEEGQFKFSKMTSTGLVEIAGSAQRGYLNLTVDGENTSNLNLMVHNRNDNGKINVTVQGDCIVSATGEATVSGKEMVTLESINEVDEGSVVSIKNDSVQIETERFEIGDGNEPLLLGFKTLEFIRKFIDLLSASTVTTQLGQMPLLNKEEIKELKEELEVLLSQKSFTD